MRIFLALPLLLVGFSANSVAACNVAGAAQLQSNLAQLASWKESKDAVEVTWNDFVLEQGPEQRRKLIEAFANTDACIKGRPREIKFFGRGKLIGIASPNTGISLIDPATSSSVKGALSKPAPLTVRGKAIKVGMSADEVFAILKNSEMLNQEVKGDPTLPGSLRVTKRYNADGKTFTLVMARATATGSYLVASIALAAK